MSKPVTFEERERAQTAIRVANNNAITHGDLYQKHKGRARRQTPPPLPVVPAKTFSAAEWAQVSEILGRIGLIIGAMESDAVRKEYELLSASLPFMGDEYVRLTRALIGENK